MARLFYFVTAIVLVVFTAIGFGSFYTKGMSYPGRPIPPPIKTLIIVHAAAMSLWVLLLVAQSFLIRVRKVRVHRALGKVGIALALACVVLGLRLGIRSAAVTPDEVTIWRLPAPQFMAVPFFSILVFAVLVGLGLLFRRRSTVHPAMMISATLATLAAAVSRIDALNAYYEGTMCEWLFGPYFMTCVLAVLLLVVRCVLLRRIDVALTLGVAAVWALALGSWRIATTDAWKQFAAFLLG